MTDQEKALVKLEEDIEATRRDNPDAIRLYNLVKDIEGINIQKWQLPKVVICQNNEKRRWENEIYRFYRHIGVRDLAVGT